MMIMVYAGKEYKATLTSQGLLIGALNVILPIKPVVKVVEWKIAA
tara:strand:- start:164 stop:298 length:135 start_codon:yes stop_codon:yes gene_type:complete